MSYTSKLLGAGLLIAIVVIAYQFVVDSGETPVIENNTEIIADELIENETKKENNVPAVPASSGKQKEDAKNSSDVPAEEPVDVPDEKPAEEPEEEEILCPAIYIPVCGLVQGQKTDFGNECEANKEGAVDITDGVCEDPEPPAEDVQCPANYDPVCGKVGIQKKTFDNQCKAQKANATNITDGKCKEPVLQLAP